MGPVVEVKLGRISEWVCTSNDSWDATAKSGIDKSPLAYPGFMQQRGGMAAWMG